MKRQHLAIIASAVLGSSSAAALAVDPVLVDNFNNGAVENSDAIPNFWTPRLSGSSSAATENGGFLRLTAGGSQFPHGQIASGVRSEFNFFRTPIVVQANGLNFTSATGSLNKAIFRMSLSSRQLFDAAPSPPAPAPGLDDSEYWADDVLALRIESGNGTPGQYQIALGIKENFPQHNSEYDGFWLFNPLIDTNATFPGPIRNVTLAYSPKFWNLTITHDTSDSNPAPQTRSFTGAVDQFISNWHDQSDAGPITGDSSLILQSQLNNAGASEAATVNLDQLTVGQLRQAWQGGAAGDWGNPANWSDANILHVNGDGSTSSVPNFVGANVRFGPAAGPVTVTTDLDQTLGAMIFDSAQPYTIQPGGLGQGTLQVDTRWFANEVTVLQGSHTIVSPMNVYKDTVLTVTPANSVLTISGQVTDSTGTGAANLTKVGAGRADVLNVRFNALNVTGGTLKVINGAAPQDPASTSVVKSLAIAGGPAAPTAKLDLGNSAMIIDYTGSSPIEDVRQLLRAGLTSGNGIVTSAGTSANRLGYMEASQLVPGGGTYAGQTVDGTAVVIAFTVGGDADLNKVVNIQDFGTLASNFNLPGSWAKGDFDYNGVVNIQDFSVLAGNFNRTLASEPGRSAVPEPAAIGLVAVSMFALIRTRRRSSTACGHG